jgi:effector-binding domain-containing protein
MTLPTPFYETGNPVPYVGVVSTIPMMQLSDPASGFGQLFSWLEIQGIEPSGPSFYRYKEFHKNGLITLEIGVPADVPDSVDTEFIKGVIPGGRYLSLLHTGDYSGLQAATEFLLKWAEDHELKFQTHEDDDVSLWTARLEWYLVDPTREPDPAEWQTKISILLE